MNPSESPVSEQGEKPYPQRVVEKSIRQQRAWLKKWFPRVLAVIGAITVVGAEVVPEEERTELFINKRIGCGVFTALCVLYVFLDGQLRAITKKQLDVLHQQDRLEPLLEKMLRQNPAMERELRAIACNYDIDL